MTGTEITLGTGKPCVASARQVICDIFSVDKKPLLIWSLCDKLIEHRLLNNIRFDETLKLSEDQWFLWQVLRKVERFSYAPQFSYHYRMREGSATHTPPKRENGTYIDAMERIRADARDMDRETQHVLEMKYWQIAIGNMKDIVISGSHEFDDVLENQQRKLRHVAALCLVQPGLSKLGILYFLLPRRLVWVLRPLLVAMKG